MWSTWMAAFEREYKRYNLEILAKDLNEQYDAYLCMKIAEVKLHEEDTYLATFHARDIPSRRFRDEHDNASEVDNSEEHYHPRPRQ